MIYICFARKRGFSHDDDDDGGLLTVQSGDHDDPSHTGGTVTPHIVRW